MANPTSIDYRCTDPTCDNPLVGRNLLTVKKIVFLEMGPGGRTVRSRVSNWLCPVCVIKDSDWNREKWLTPVLPHPQVIRG